MHEQTSLAAAARAIAKHAPRIPFLKFCDGASQLTLCYRKKGERIADPDWDMDAEALQSGVYQRFRRISGDTDGFTWMRISSIEEDEILEALRERFLSMSHVEIESIPLDASWQLMQHEQAAVRAGTRRGYSR
jgi:hypothetical protein